jgi:hypothetical protein
VSPEIEHEPEHDEDFVDISIVPPTLLVEAWRGSESAAIPVPSALVAEVLA